jgi:nitrite reductase (NADH) small subunit
MTTLLTLNEYNLGPATQIPPGEGREFLVGGRRVAVFRTRSGEVYAVQAECPHRQGLLADGLTGGSTVICPFHAWKFDLSTGTPLLGACSLTTHTLRLSDTAELWLTLSSEPDSIATTALIGAGATEG